MRRIAGFSAVCMGVMLMASIGYAAEKYYVQSEKAKVMWKPSFGAEVMDVVKKGHEFREGMREGNWVKVRHAYEIGYVPAILVSTRPPLARVGIIKGDEEKLAYSIRRRASTYTSAAAARGLTQESRGRLSKEEEANFRALEQIEAYAASADELQKFIEGRPL